MGETNQVVQQKGIFFTVNDIFIVKKILKENKSLLVLGDRGAGKTAALKYLISIINENEKLLIFDDYDEIEVVPRLGKVFKVGFDKKSDIVGEQTKINPHVEMVSKGLLLPFDRVIADELFPKEIEEVLSVLHGQRSGIFSVNFSNPEDGLKHIYLKTMYPRKKVLTQELLSRIENEFSYCITVGENIKIEKIQIIKTQISFEKVN